MWSIVQHRQIGESVANLHSRGFHNGPDVESAQAVSSQQGNGKTTPDQDSTPGSQCEGGATKTEDKIWVEEEGDDDPLNPMNWNLMSRAKNILILSLLIFVQAWSGAAESMANSAASKEFAVGQVAENLSTAMYLLGIGSGALFAGPISETVGRNPTYLVATFFYLFFVLGSALTPTFGGQVVCRYLVGLFSSATLSINGSSVRDQFRPVKRSLVFPVIAWANVAAPAIAPIAGGWITQNPHLGWRWTEWITLIISVFGFLVAFFFLPETYFPILLDWKAAHMRRVTGDSRYVSPHAEQPSFLKRMKKVGLLPLTLLVREPVISVLGGYLIFIYVLLFTFQSGFDYIFKDTYGLSSGMTGSCFGAIAAGATTFTLGAPWLYSWARRKTEYVQGAPVNPEFRLWPAIVAGPCLPITLFWLGWTDYTSLPMIIPLVPCFLFGMVLIAIYVSSYEYIIDSYGEHSAIALASITMARYLVAGGMVMAARPLYEGIGVHWTMTLLGCISVLLAPAPLIFWKYGPKLRAKSPYGKS
ncbi:major facilitator superfamily domain-containing protein [Xylariales sp. PMI_506]|nr:major facilitator superfamily domain-containing protein [Xylariales sp. PMI_506]